MKFLSVPCRSMAEWNKIPLLHNLMFRWRWAFILTPWTPNHRQWIAGIFEYVAGYVSDPLEPIKVSWDFRESNRSSSVIQMCPSHCYDCLSTLLTTELKPCQTTQCSSWQSRPNLRTRMICQDEGLRWWREIVNIRIAKSLSMQTRRNRYMLFPVLFNVRRRSLFRM
jgi:hypothetical protein